MQVSDFDFELPDSAIAQNAIEPRDMAKMLYANNNQVKTHYIVRDLVKLLKKGDCLVLNDTKVIPARLLGSRKTGGKVECTLHLQKSLDCWIAFAKPAKKCNSGDIITFNQDFKATVLNRNGGELTLQFNKTGAELITALHKYGKMPLPPYIKRNAKTDKHIIQNDKARYQTVFAKNEGAVAAPTAGLHLTNELLNKIKSMGVVIVKITLHVGAGTFLPVTTKDTNDHKMHAEIGIITQKQAEQINRAKQQGGRIVAIGTTALRLLESATDDDGVVKQFNAETKLFITPDYKFKIVNCLMTNYHLPKSTLFMLVSAFLGLNTMKDVYKYAIQNNYRFYSYGDSSFLERIL